MLPATNRLSDANHQIEEMKKERIFLKLQIHSKGRAIITITAGNKSEENQALARPTFLDVPKRTKCLKAAVIDTDGALLEELFKAQKFSLQYRKIITTNALLQRFFENIHYWGGGRP